MANIEKRHIIDSNILNGESYFTSFLKEAYTRGLLSDSEIENIQLQCIELLAYKSEGYSNGKSSSIRIEAAQSIMKSILYTIGLYLKSLTDTGCAASELKTAVISKMYEKGRKLINVKFNAARHLYKLAQRNKLTTLNYTYNATLNDNGIGIFFKAYDPDYEAHETPASIDYQLCNPVTDLIGIEYIQKYIESLYLENEFCRNFSREDICCLLYGYDEGYKDLLINIFERVLTSAIGCALSNHSILKLDISEEELRFLENELSKDDDQSIALKVRNGSGKVINELNIINSSLISYVEKSLQRITWDIIHAVRTNTLGKTFPALVNPDCKPKIQFLSGSRMDDEDYRRFIDELMTCRYSSDKLAFIKEKVKAFEDVEDVLLDAQLKEEEIKGVLDTLEDVEIAKLMSRHSFKSDIQAVDLTEAELKLQAYLKSFISKLAPDRQKEIFYIANHLIDD